MEKKQQAHVVMVPMPLQGHIKPLLCLAQLLSEAGLYVSFVNTTQSHKRFADLETLTAHFPNLHFECISDGLPEDHPRALVTDYFEGLKKETGPRFKELLLSLETKPSTPPITSIIADGVLPFAVGVAEELGIPIFSFCVHSARFLWGFLNIPKLIEDGQLPFSGMTHCSDQPYTTASSSSSSMEFLIFCDFFIYRKSFCIKLVREHA